MLRLRLAGVVALALISGSFVIAQQPDPEVQKISDAYMQAWGKGDGKAIAALYTPNGVRAGSDGQLYRGRDAIAQGFAKAFGGPYEGSKLTLKTDSDQVITPDGVRITTGTFEVTGVNNPPAGASLRGRFVNTVVRQDGQWMLASTAAIGMSK